jgi:hypothetical protein
MKTNITPNFMENTNGVFFSLSDISDKDINELLVQVDELKAQDDAMNDPSESDIPFDTGSIDDNKNDLSEIDENMVLHEDSVSSAPECKKSSFDYDKQMMRDIENSVNRTNKKSIQVKYSIAKKKYNKQYIQVDSKKIDNTDLKELVEEKYML